MNDDQKLQCKRNTSQLSETFPFYLDQLNEEISIYNIGISGSDITQSVHLLLDLLRVGLIPDQVTFLDGINEKQGFIQQSKGSNLYQYQINCFDLINEHFQSKNKFFKNKLARKIHKIFGNFKESPNTDKFIFAEQQSKEFRLSVDIINQLSKTYGFSSNFFLQPTVWDILPDSYNYDSHELARWNYLNEVYLDILSYKSNFVTDLRSESKELLLPDHFMDWQHLNSDGNYALSKILSNKIGIN